MKKLFIILAAALVLMTACGTDQNSGSGSSGGKEDVISDFKGFTAEAAGPAEVKERLDQLLKNSDTETSDTLIREYLIYMDQVIAGEASYEKDAMENAGFRYISIEGNEQPVIDYHFIDAYSGKISQEMADFTNFMALNSDQPWAKDGGLAIPLQDLADRVALGEKFIVSYPESFLGEQIKTQYRYYLISLLGGLDNTTLVDYNTNTIDREFITAYEYFQETYPDLKTAETVKSFYTELEANDFAPPYTYQDQEKRDAFRSRLDRLADEAVSRLEQQ